MLIPEYKDFFMILLTAYTKILHENKKDVSIIEISSLLLDEAPSIATDENQDHVRRQA